jgi:hypothetical protein
MRGPDALRGLSLNVWTYRGAVGSAFASGGPGQLGAVRSSLRRNRWGTFAALRNDRASLLLGYSERSDEGELGDNTAKSPRTVIDSTGRLISAAALIRPAPQGSPFRPLRLVARLDHFRPVQGTDAESRFITAGVIWELAKPVALALDYQEQLPRDGAGITTTKTWFLHTSAAF